ncbi:MAG: DUF4859 domain-containing protein [Prevotellaceae bacterium]|nr:DUF4859 domain-containing protein [Prevotellaceae bacterium]
MKWLALAVLLLALLPAACKDDSFTPKTEPTNPENTLANTDTPEDTTFIPSEEDTSRIYKPREFAAMDWYRSSSRWCYARSRQSEHFIVFWETGFGSDPNASTAPQALRVDVDDLLAKAEAFYDLNINTLKFAETGVGKSNLDKYKMMIFLHYQTEWLATGSGYDDQIGALWVNPSTCQPAGATIAHEIGHSFQYQVHCDLKGGAGFRYGYGGNGGNTFWEQTAQWQAYQSYPAERFVSSHFGVYTGSYFRHICSEEYRYASYFIHHYWTSKHGVDFIGRLWRGAQQPEDPMQAYMRITNVSVEQFNDEIYEQASRLVTWDIDDLRELGQSYIGAHSCKMVSLGGAKYRPDTSFCVEPTGYNVIPLNVPNAGATVAADFAAMPNAAGYRVNNSMLGFRYGFVALRSNGSRVYGDMHSSLSGTATFVIPESCARLWFVVSGASPTYAPHAWDDNRSNDVQLPYSVEFKNTNLYGTTSFDGTETPMDTTLVYNVAFPADQTAYTGATVKLDQVALAKLSRAFVLQPDEIIGQIAQSGKPIKLYALENNGNLNGSYTASSDSYKNIYGHYFTSDGAVCGWSDATSRIFSEFTPAQLSFFIGQYPGRCAAGDKFTFRQALVYEYETGKTVKATFVFNIIIE